MEFKNRLKEKLSFYIEKTKEYNDKQRDLNILKEEKNELESEIIEFIENTQMNNKIFVLNDCKIQHKTSWQYQNMSLKLIEKSLREYCENHSIFINVDDYLSFIKEKRDKKQKEELKIEEVKID